MSASVMPVIDFDVSIIIVSFNTCDVLRDCLVSVVEEAKQFSIEILVVDNASQDGSVEMIEREYPQITLLRSSVNLGFGNANNLALRQARGRYFVLLNSDAYFSPGALALAMTVLAAVVLKDLWETKAD